MSFLDHFDGDGEHVKTVGQAPAYPMQMMVAVFDFAAKAPEVEHVPLLAVDYVRGDRSAAARS